jgi:hypothetical protein
MRNPKAEGRNPKLSPKAEIRGLKEGRNPKEPRNVRSGFLRFGIRIYFGTRNSDFGINFGFRKSGFGFAFGPRISDFGFKL